MKLAFLKRSDLCKDCVIIDDSCSCASGAGASFHWLTSGQMRVIAPFWPSLSTTAGGVVRTALRSDNSTEHSAELVAGDIGLPPMDRQRRSPWSSSVLYQFAPA
jgi:hypothetical protein